MKDRLSSAITTSQQSLQTIRHHIKNLWAASLILAFSGSWCELIESKHVIHPQLVNDSLISPAQYAVNHVTNPTVIAEIILNEKVNPDIFSVEENQIFLRNCPGKYGCTSLVTENSLLRYDNKTKQPATGIKTWDIAFTPLWTWQENNKFTYRYEDLINNQLTRHMKREYNIDTEDTAKVIQINNVAKIEILAIITFDTLEQILLRDRSIKRPNRDSRGKDLVGLLRAYKNLRTNSLNSNIVPPSTTLFNLEHE